MTTYHVNQYDGYPWSNETHSVVVAYMSKGPGPCYRCGKHEAN
jgi:hypothetical protein